MDTRQPLHSQSPKVLLSHLIDGLLCEVMILLVEFIIDSEAIAHIAKFPTVPLWRLGFVPIGVIFTSLAVSRRVPIVMCFDRPNVVPTFTSSIIFIAQYFKDEN